MIEKRRTTEFLLPPSAHRTKRDGNSSQHVKTREEPDQAPAAAHRQAETDTRGRTRQGTNPGPGVIDDLRIANVCLDGDPSVLFPAVSAAR
jgi:hypothetical protein